ncbi:hypothetical protein [Streptomyces sp. 900105755]
MEGTDTFGAGLSRYLLVQQVQVYEVNVALEDAASPQHPLPAAAT